MVKKLLFLMIIVYALAFGIAAQDAPPATTVTGQSVPFVRINEVGVQFTYDAALADAVTVTQYPAATENVMIPTPAYTEFNFTGYADGGDFLRFAPMPRIDVFTIADFGPYDHMVAELDALSALLAQRPDLNQYVMADPGSPDALRLPFLPIFNAAQVFRAQPQYIEVAGLRGVRYLVYFSQALNPIAEGEVFYTFQAITTDGQHYVSAVLPVNTGVLPAEGPIIDDYDTFAAEYQTYLMETVASLTQANGESFTPALSQLDAMMQSVTVNG